MNIMEETYQNLTSVNIEEQRKLWNERGKGYYGEYLLFNTLYQKIQGCCKILMNLQIPTSNGKTTEIDLLLIHETGLYVFEVKHYKGTIYGKEDQEKWTQYFRTAPNAHFQNPIRQNQYHISALEKLFSSIPIKSIIVFTNSECVLKVKCMSNSITVCTLKDLYYVMDKLSMRNSILDADDIDAIFKKLSVYSPMLNKSINVSENETPLANYINDIIVKFQDNKKALEANYEGKQKELKRKQILTVIGAIIVCIIWGMACTNALTKIQDNADKQVAIAQKELSDFAQKFEQVKVFNEGGLSFSDNLISVSDVNIEPSEDINNAIIVSFALTHIGNDYGIRLNEGSVIILILNDGSVLECAVYNDKYPFKNDVYIGNGSGCKILPHEFYDIYVDDISYVKLSNVDVWTYINYQREIVVSGYEIEVYDVEKTIY